MEVARLVRLHLSQDRTDHHNHKVDLARSAKDKGHLVSSSSSSRQEDRSGNNLLVSSRLGRLDSRDSKAVRVVLSGCLGNREGIL